MELVRTVKFLKHIAAQPCGMIRNQMIIVC